MRIAYCTNVRLPSERAHGHQIAQVCDALAHLGHSVQILAPHRKNPIHQAYTEYYGADPRVELVHLGSFDPIDRSLLPRVVQLPILHVLLRRALAHHLTVESFDLLYTRAPALLPTLLRTGAPVVLELHQLPRRGRMAFVERCNVCRLIVCLTHSMRETLIEWGVAPDRVIAEGDAVDLHRFLHLSSQNEARAQIGLQTDRTVVGYVGRLRTLGMEKGVRVLLEALRVLQSERSFLGVVVGGPESDRRAYERMAQELSLTSEDVRFLGEVDHTHVPTMLIACDILAMPFPDLPHYRHHMSPLKMFEYMAAHRPIVTSDLPTVRDVLSEETAFFCMPGDPASLGEVLKEIREQPESASERANAALQLVQRHTWEERMRRILEAAARE